MSKETESGSRGVNVAVCLAEPEERMLHQLQLRPEGLMGKTTQQGSRVRRPLSARANWSLRPALTPTVQHFANIHMYGTALTGVFHQKPPDQEGLCCAPTQPWRSVRRSVLTISHLRRTSPPAPPTVTARPDSGKDRRLLISMYFSQFNTVHQHSNIRLF